MTHTIKNGFCRSFLLGVFMKQYVYKFLSFLLTIVIISLFVFSNSFFVYASGGGGGGSFAIPWNQMSRYERWCTVIDYLCFEYDVFVDKGDFKLFLENYDAFLNLFEEEPDDLITVTDEGLTIPADLVALIKQALIEYANETNPFKIEQTYPVNAIPASTFPDKSAYEAFKSYCASHAYTLADPQGSYMYIGDITPYIKEGGGFVRSGSNIVVYNSDWRGVNIPIDYYQFKYNADVGYYVEIKENYGVLSSIAHYNPNKTNFKEYQQNGFIVTKDGGRIRVFNSASEFMDYNAGQRKVYFGKGFYDYDPADITVTWDEISDKIGRMDDLLQDLIDIITDNPNISEEELEELIDQLIGKIGEIGDQIGDKTDQTNTLLGGISSTLNGITSSLSGYFSSVLSYLEQILAAIKALVWIESDNKVDKDKQDLFDLIDKIWEDPENGSQEAADALTGSFSDVAHGLTKKFPFSIPWDIYNLFRVFSGAPAPDEATFHTMTLGVQPFTVDNEDLEQDVHDAPYFKLPLRLDSYGIYEEVVVDLADFKSVSTLGRGLLSVLFAVFLIKFTIKIIELFKGGSSD